MYNAPQFFVWQNQIAWVNQCNLDGLKIVLIWMPSAISDLIGQPGPTFPQKHPLDDHPRGAFRSPAFDQLNHSSESSLIFFQYSSPQCIFKYNGVHWCKAFSHVKQGHISRTPFLKHAWDTMFFICNWLCSRRSIDYHPIHMAWTVFPFFLTAPQFIVK